jgi:multiple sugar transport system substrate-binding protein
MRKLGIAALVIGVGWYLFAATIAYYAPVDEARRPLRVAHRGGYAEYRMWERVIDAFHESHPGIRIKHELVVGRYQSVIAQQVVAGSAPEIMTFEDEPFPNFAPTAFADLTELVRGSDCGFDLEADYFTSAWQSFEVDGRLYGLPVSGGTLAVYYNEDCFLRAERHHGRRLSRPHDNWTVDEFRALCDQLTCDLDGDGRVDQFGLCQPWWVYYLPFVYAFGAEVLDENRTEWRLVGPEAQAAFAFYQSLRFPKRVVPYPSELGQMNQDMAFLTGRVAMAVSGPWFQFFLAETTMREHYGVVSVPAGPGGRGTRVTWSGICLNAAVSGERRRAAWEFARFVCSQAGQDAIALTGRAIPARKQSAVLYAAHPEYPACGKFVEALSYARLQPITADWKRMDRTIKRHLSGLLREDPPRLTPAEFLQALAGDPFIRERFGSTRSASP